MTCCLKHTHSDQGRFISGNLAKIGLFCSLSAVDATMERPTK